MTGAPASQGALAPWFLFAAEALRGAQPDVLRNWIEDLRDLPGPLAFSAHDWIEALGEDPQALEIDYVRLFLSPAGALAPPWQSVYTQDRTLMGQTHHDALGWYRLLGVAPPADSEPADHAGLLAAAYALLLADEQLHVRAQHFARNHLAWFGPFGQRVAAQARHPFFQRLGELLQALSAAAGTHT